MARRNIKKTFVYLIAVLAVMIPSTQAKSEPLVIKFSGGITFTEITFSPMNSNTNPNLDNISSNGSDGTYYFNSIVTFNGFVDIIDTTPYTGYNIIINLDGGADLSTLEYNHGFDNLRLQIKFYEDFSPVSSDTFDLFDPTDGVDLRTELNCAEIITTPDGWSLDYDTGVMSAVPEPSVQLLAATMAIALAVFYRSQRMAWRKRIHVCSMAIVFAILLSHNTQADLMSTDGSEGSYTFTGAITITSGNDGPSSGGSSDFDPDDGISIINCMGSIYCGNSPGDGTILIDYISMPLYANIDSQIGFGRLIRLNTCCIEISFSDGFAPDQTETFDLFFPMGTVDLGSLLSDAEIITTPDGWSLDYDTGVMSAVPEPSGQLLAATVAIALAVFYRKRK